jgi:DnaJ-class molecular chaperone
MSENYYKILGINEDSSPEEIKKEYRKLSLKYHPDKNIGNPDAEQKFKTINEAYQILSDENERKKYDMSRRNPFMNGPNGVHGHQNGMNPMDDVIKMFFGGNMHGFPPGFANMSSMGNMNNVGSMGGANIKVFRNGQPVDINMMNKPPPIIKNVYISLAQSYNGDQLPIQVERWLFEDGIRKCENETLYIPISKGIDDKEIIILREKGNVMDNNLKGDVKIIINIQNETQFKREGLNLHMEKEITLKESLCGFQFIIQHVNGKQLRFSSESNIPTKPGSIKLVPNYGMIRDDNVGNLSIKFTVKYPSKFTKDQLDGLYKIL